MNLHSERIETDQCEVEDNDIYVASYYNDFAQIPQGENELNNEVLHFCNSYFWFDESYDSFLDDPHYIHTLHLYKK